jgi:phenylacetate-coenzyme A ligase PaaK-like adenylate-forming protein
LKNDEILKIKGRSDYIITPHDRNVYSVTLDPAFMKEGIYGYQIIQKDKNKIEINLICNESKKETYKKDVIDFFESLGFKDPSVHFLNQLQREKNGKVLLIKRDS